MADEGNADGLHHPPCSIGRNELTWVAVTKVMPARPPGYIP
jgi:hypothetical protein